MKWGHFVIEGNLLMYLDRTWSNLILYTTLCPHDLFGYYYKLKYVFFNKMNYDSKQIGF